MTFDATITIMGLSAAATGTILMTLLVKLDLEDPSPLGRTYLDLAWLGAFILFGLFMLMHLIHLFIINNLS